MKFIRITLYILTSLSVLLASALLLLHYQKDEIIRLFLNEANKHIKTPVQTSQVKLSLFEEFPQVTVVLHNVRAKESLPASDEYLLQAGTLLCSFDALDMLQGRYVIRRLMLKDAQVNIRYTPTGKNNFSIIESSAESGGEVAFDFEEVSLDNVRVVYDDQSINHTYETLVKRGDAVLSYKKDVLEVALVGDVFSDQFRIGKSQYLEKKPLKLNSKLIYDFNTSEVSILPSSLIIKDASFSLQGRYMSEPSSFIDLKIKGEQSSLQTLWSLLPVEMSKAYEAYRSKGKAWFDAGIKGYITRKDLPEITVNFGLEDAEIAHPDWQMNFTDVSVKGSYTVPQLDRLQQARLHLSQLQGRMNHSFFEGELLLTNFRDLQMSGSLGASLQLEDWLPWIAIESLSALRGSAEMKARFSGRVKDFQKDISSKKVKIDGEVWLSDTSFKLEQWQYPFEQIDGVLLFNNQDLVVNQLKGKSGMSELDMKGYLKNVVAFALKDNEPLKVEADIKAPLLDVDELLSAYVSPDVTDDNPYYFNIDPRLQLDLNCFFDHAKFRRFRGQQIEGRIVVKDQVAKAEPLHLQMAGGEAFVWAEVDARPEEKVLLRTQSEVRGLALDSLFYVFEDFGQDFLRFRHLKGRLSARENSFIPFSRNLEILDDELLSAVTASIKQGELIDFEPLQALKSYFKKDKLQHCYFSDVENEILVKNRTISVSPMLVHTNLSSFEVEGTHTFDQQIDYRLRIPLRSVSRNYAAKIETTGIDPNLFLTVKGTTDDFKIAYDKKAVKAKIQNDLHEERIELKKAFQQKGLNHKDTVELSNEYFDF